MFAVRFRSFVVCVAVPIAVYALRAGAAPQLPSTRAATPSLPERIADSTFWRMITEFSEPNGFFSSDNFVSNEGELQYVIKDLAARHRPGGVYLGVGPEQNFTYIAAFNPRIAFICDIRRQNMIEHLMYKALFALSADRGDFLSRLWSRERPEGLDASSTPDTLAARFGKVAADSVRYRDNLAAIFAELVDRRRFALTSEDSLSLRYVYSAFYIFGPNVGYASRPGLAPGPTGRGRAGQPFVRNSLPFVDGHGRLIVGVDSLGRHVTSGAVTVDSLRRAARRSDSIALAAQTPFGATRPVVTIDSLGRASMTYPVNVSSAPSTGQTFAHLMAENDGAGVQRGWLATEENFLAVKEFQARNLLVPIVGDFAGPRALRAIGTYLRDHDAMVSLFYVSNVEQYLFQGDVWKQFYANVATLPFDSTSSFIRSISDRRWIAPHNPRSLMAQITSPIDAIVRAHQAGELSRYEQVIEMRRKP